MQATLPFRDKSISNLMTTILNLIWPELALRDLPTLIGWAGFNVSANTVCIGYLGNSFTGQKTQPTVSKYWREKRYKSKENPEKANNTEYSKTINTHTYKI